MDASSQRVPTRAGWALVVALGFWGLGALGGGFFLARWPDGSGMGFDPAILDGTPFSDFLVPGLILFALGAAAVASAVVLVRALRRREALSPTAAQVVLLVGLGILAWIVGEMAFLWATVAAMPEGDRAFFYAFWAVYLPLSVAIALLAWRVARRHRA